MGIQTPPATAEAVDIAPSSLEPAGGATIEFLADRGRSSDPAGNGVRCVGVERRTEESGHRRMSPIEPTPDTTVRRLPQRGAYDRETITEIIDAAPICHVGLVSNERPVVIPMLHARVDEHVYLHGSPGSRLLRNLGDGGPTCLSFTILDALVLARSALHHSMNYRSVVLFGRGRAVTDRQEKLRALEAFVEHVAPGRWHETRQPDEQEFKATAVVAVPIEEASAKVRTGPPVDDKADLDGPYWAGLVPLPTRVGPLIPAPDLPDSIAAPASLGNLAERYAPGGDGDPAKDRP
jgi:nitroimidazol reductase NimA-like FMN-containing flavoprotein (pyridoxamine 5'-phosphate oxidase superfamily)